MARMKALGKTLNELLNDNKKDFIKGLYFNGEEKINNIMLLCIINSLLNSNKNINIIETKN